MPKEYKVLAGSSEAGGADCLLPVIRLLKASKCRVFTLAGKNAYSIFAQNNIIPDKIIEDKDCFSSCRSLFDKFHPDIMLTGLLGDKTNIDYSLIKIAKEKSLPVLSILDSWMNYSDRINDPATNNPLGFLPDKIAIMDKIALDEMVSEGVPKEKCFITGHPRFDSLVALRKKRQSRKFRNLLRSRYNIKPKDIVVVFYAHPVKKFYPNKYLGYDETDVFPIFFKAMESLRSDIPLKVIFKEHPRGKTLSYTKRKIPNVTYIENGNADDLLIVSDFAVSMSSTLLIFSAAMGIPVFSIQPNLISGRDLNVLTRVGGFPIFSYAQQLCLCLLKELNSKFKHKAPDWFMLDGNVSKRIVDLVLESLKGDEDMSKKMLHPFLIGEKCYLRGLEPSDLNGNYFQWFNDQENTKFMKNGSFPNSEARMRAFFERMTLSENDIVLAIIDKKNNVHIGNLGLHNIDWFYRKTELGIIIGNKAYHGKGFAVEAIELLLDHAFSRLNLHKVYLRTEEGNSAAIRTFERVGFKREGLIRQECFRRNKYTNSIYMGILSSEFPNK